MASPTTTRPSSSRSSGGRGPRRKWLQALTGALGLEFGRSRRDVACPTCAHVNDLVVARWCGKCGRRLTEIVVDVAQRERERRDTERLRRIATPIFVVILGAAMLIPAALQGESAPPRGESARGDAARTGVVSEIAPSAPREVAWTVEGTDPDLGAAEIAPATDHAILLQPGSADVLDLTTGAPLRSVDLLATQDPWSLARAVGDLLLLPDLDQQQIVARHLTRPDGDLWRADLGGFTRETALGGLVVEGDFVFNSGVGELQRVELATGTGAWRVDIGRRDGLGVAGLVGAGTRNLTLLTVRPLGAQIQVGSSATPSLTGLDLGSTRVSWTLPLEAADALAPQAANDRIVVHQDSVRGPQQVVVVRNAADGSELTSLPVLPPLLDVAVVDDLVLVLDGGGVRGWSDRGAQESFFWPVNEPTAPLLVSEESQRIVVPEGGLLSILDLGGSRVARIEAEGATNHALVDGIVVTSQAGLRASAWDLAGNQLWTRLLQTPATAGLATDGELVVANVPGGLVTIDGRKGERLTSVDRIDEDGFRVPVPGSVALDDGRAIVSPFGGGPSGRGLSALDARSGIRSWDRNDETTPAFGPITRTPGVVWVPVADQIHGYDTIFGRRTFASLSGVPRGPLAVTPEVVVGTPAQPICAGRDACSTAIRAIEVETRDEAWTSPAPACGPPSIRDGRVLVPTTSGPWAVSVTEGQLLWVGQSDDGHTPGCGPLAVGADMIVQGNGRRLSAWEPTSGAATWSVDLGEALATDPVIAGNEVVVGTTNGQLTSLDLTTGEVLWQFVLPAPPMVDPVIVEGRWVLLLRDGRVVGLR